MATEPTPSKSSRRFVAARLASTALFVSPPFVALIVFLALHRLGMIERHWRIAFERTLILNVILYWLLTTLLVATLIYRHAVARHLQQNKEAAVLLIISSLFSLGFAEVALRLLRPPTAPQTFRQLPSSLLHHRSSPNARGSGMGKDLVVTNEDGFRTPYGRQEFRRHRERIVLLGDSFVFGLGVAGEQAVAAVLEHSLRESMGSDDIAVLNTGAISYSPLIQRTLFREIVADYSPTLTLLLLDVNDIGDDLQYGRENLSQDPQQTLFDVPAPPSGPSLCDRFALCLILKPFFWRLNQPFETLQHFLPDFLRGYDYYRFRVEIDGVRERNRFFIIRHPLEKTLPHFQRTLGNIRDIAADAKSRGSEFVLVISPRYFHWNDDECPDNWEKFRYGVDEPYELEYFRFFESIENDVDFPILSLLPAFQASEEFPLVFAHDSHWNEAGHQVAGQALAEYLRANGYVR